jgi:glycosyltransferase involved in cell wall biosynthesis
MKIVVVAGVARSLTNFRGPLLKSIVDMGHEVVACAPDRPEDVIGGLAELGVAYQQVPIQRTGVNPLYDMGTVMSLRRLFLQLEPDYALFYTIKPVIYGSFAARMARVPHVFSMITGLGYAFSEGSLKQRLLGSVVQTLYRHALKGNTAVFFQNPDDRQLFLETQLLRDPGKPVLINGSGVDLAHYRKVPQVTDQIVFLLIARLLRDKGIYEYVEAARIVTRKHPDVVFRLVGPFDSNPSAIGRSMVEEWQREGVIEYLGETRDVRPYIAESSVYVLPSYREGTPRTVLEAMAMGRPIVTTDAPGCRETVVDGANGYLVPVKNVNRLAEAMERFIENPELIPAMGEESWRIAVEKYDVHKVNAVILQTMGLL